jgi:hypothetical protein
MVCFVFGKKLLWASMMLMAIRGVSQLITDIEEG